MKETCERCGNPFGLALGEVSRSETPGLCTLCVKELAEEGKEFDNDLPFDISQRPFIRDSRTLGEIFRRIEDREADIRAGVIAVLSEVKYDGIPCRECGTTERTSHGWCARCYVMVKS